MVKNLYPLNQPLESDMCKQNLLNWDLHIKFEVFEHFGGSVRVCASGSIWLTPHRGPEEPMM